MKQVREGNDISVIWSILSEDAPVNLGGYELSLYLTSKFEKKKLTDFKANGNKISWTFYGKDQNARGTYTLTLVLNEGKEDMHTVDACDFIKIVACTCQLSDGTDDEGIETSVMEFESTIDFSAQPIEVDSELSETSENPVQNKVITGALREVVETAQTTISAVAKIKQDTLVSGENIKTINGESLLGEGNIVIKGGAGSYDDTKIKEDIKDLQEKDTQTDTKLAELSVETTTLQPTGIIDVTHLFMPKATYAGELNSGVFAPVINNEGKYCALFRVKQGTTFEVSGLVGANSARAWLKYNNKGKIISKSEANISVNETLIMDHEGYIVFNHYGNPTDVFSVKTDAEILPLNTTIGLCNIKKDTEVITQNIQALEENTSSKIDAIRNEVQSNSISTQLVNLLNPNDVIDFQILDSNGGGIHSNNGYWTSGFIEVENGVTYATNIKSIRRYALYDEDKVWISGGDNVNEIAASSNGFVRFSVEKSVDSRQPNEVGFGVKGTDYSVEYGAFEVSVKGERLALYSDLPNIALEKKSIAIIGDSAVQASNWASNMGANLGFARCDIYAVGGYTWRNNYQDGVLVNCVGVLLNRMIATNIKYDVILFQIGGNDITTWQPEVYGSVENALSEYNYKGYANATTTAECVRYYLSMIREMYPSSLILVGTPFQRMKSEGNAEDVADILRKICAALCIQTIDGCKELGFSQLTECTTPYYNDGNMGVANNRTGLSRSNPIYNYIEDATGNIVDYTTATNDGILKSGYSKKYGIYTYDGKHQNAEGERKVLEYMTAKLKTFVA